MSQTEDIVTATRRYEAWLRRRITLVPSDLALKHKTMRQTGFGFLRATYYRWAQLWPVLCAEAASAPRILCVGDLHIENFGTWRDAEGRLIWGVNDFDEAHHAAYANDLVRLAASAMIAAEEGALDLDGKEACAALLEGYAHGMAEKDARPFVLEESHAVLRDLALGKLRSAKKFWKKIEACKTADPPKAVRKLLKSHLPKGTEHTTFVSRTAGAGALGVPRYAATGDLNDSFVAREAKARAPSAFGWVSGTDVPKTCEEEVVARAIRVLDPFLHVTPDWLVRRLAPHCERIELADIAIARETRDVLVAMGAETANIHRGNRIARGPIRLDLARGKAGWLHANAQIMADAVLADWKAWRKKSRR
ncbi:MAG TPA: DUF2252 family protein [Rhizomicrobium sp.]